MVMKGSVTADASVLHYFFFPPRRAPKFFLLRFEIWAQPDWTNADTA